MALNLLIADSDHEWLAKARGFFASCSYDVTTVNNGKEAQLALYNKKYYAVILNFEIRNHPFLQVLKFITRHYPNQRIVVLVNDHNLLSAENLSEDKLAKLGVLKTFMKPWELSAVKELLDDYQSLDDILASVPKREECSAEEEIECTESALSKVGFEEFFSHKVVLFDLMIKNSDQKFTRIFKAGDPFKRDRIEKYKGNEKEAHLYFLKTDRRKFIQYNNFLAKSLIPNQKIAAESKINLLKNVCEKIWEDIYSVGLKAQHIEQGKQWAEAMALFICQQENLHKTLRVYRPDEGHLFSKSFLVSLYAIAMTKQFDWQSKSTMECAALACLLHDVGKISLPKDLFFKSASQMNASELEQYKKHPELGAKLLEPFRGVNNSIKQIILQHHEAYDGSGFPHRKKASNILMIANLVLVANDFVHIMMDQKLSPTDAARKLLVGESKNSERYYPQMPEKLIGLFSSPDKINKDVVVSTQSKKETTKKSA